MGSQSWTQLNTQPPLKSLAFNSMWGKKSPCAIPSVLSVHQLVWHVCPLPYLNQGRNLPALGNTTHHFLNLDSSCPWPTAAGLCGPCAKHSLRKKTPRDCQPFSLPGRVEKQAACTGIVRSCPQSMPPSYLWWRASLFVGFKSYRWNP